MCTIRSNHNPSQLKNIIPPDSFLCPFYRSSLILYRSLLVTYRSSLHAISPDLQTNFAHFALQFRPFCSAISPILFSSQITYSSHSIFLCHSFLPLLCLYAKTFFVFLSPTFMSFCPHYLSVFLSKKFFLSKIKQEFILHIPFFILPLHPQIRRWRDSSAG